VQSSPLWALLLIAILFGPIVYALVYGYRHRDSGVPKNEDGLEAPAMMRSLKDWTDTRTGGKGF